jgi:hypothetical protein
MAKWSNKNLFVGTQNARRKLSSIGIHRWITSIEYEQTRVRILDPDHTLLYAPNYPPTLFLKAEA